MDCPWHYTVTRAVINIHISTYINKFSSKVILIRRFVIYTDFINYMIKLEIGLKLKNGEVMRLCVIEDKTDNYGGQSDEDQNEQQQQQLENHSSGNADIEHCLTPFSHPDRKVRRCFEEL